MAETVEERLGSLESAVALLQDHTHDVQGKTVVPIYDAIEAVDSAMYDLKQKHRKELKDAECD